VRSIPPVADDLSLRLWSDDWLTPLSLDTEWSQSGPRAVDVGFGKGRFLLEHARRNPDMRLLGIERKLRRVRKLDRKATRSNLRNIRLLRMEATYAMQYLIPEQWIDICYVYFPDPWPKEKHHANRLMGPGFLDRLTRTLSEDGVVHFATDHAPYYEAVCELLDGDERWEDIEPYVLAESEVSDFELMHRDHKPIHRRSFRQATRTSP
jgi:tRNA (guanine-N7-)-methyltransferase